MYSQEVSAFAWSDIQTETLLKFPLQSLILGQNRPEKKPQTQTQKNRKKLIYVVLSRSWQDAMLCLKFLYETVQFVTDFFIAGQRSNLAMLQI